MTLPSRVAAFRALWHMFGVPVVSDKKKGVLGRGPKPHPKDPTTTQKKMMSARALAPRPRTRCPGSRLDSASDSEAISPKTQNPRLKAQAPRPSMGHKAQDPQGPNPVRVHRT